MEKNIKDYLHLHLGCECIIETKWNSKHPATIIGIHTNGNVQVDKAHGNQDYWNAEYVKPILRPLSDMTEDEWEHWYSIFHEATGNISNIIQHAEETVFLLNQHFDLLGLIPAGLAIDKTKITQPQTA